MNSSRAFLLETLEGHFAPFRVGMFGVPDILAKDPSEFVTIFSVLLKLDNPLYPQKGFLCSLLLTAKIA